LGKLVGITAGRIQCGGNSHTRLRLFCQPLQKLAQPQPARQRRDAGKVGTLDGDKFRNAGCGGHIDQQPHPHLFGLAALAAQHGLLFIV
jgi:hypothetical protein